MSKKNISPAPCEIEIQSMVSSDVDEIWNWNAPDPKNVFFELTLTIGCKKALGGNNFSLLVASHNQTFRQMTSDDKRFLLRFDTYSFEALTERLNTIIQECQSADWQGSVDQLRTRFHWEYEGYK